MNFNTMKKEIGKNLQHRRRAAGFKSAKAFADYLEISVDTYTSYEQGKSSFNVETAWVMADALDCTLDELCGRTPPSPKLVYPDERQRLMNLAFEHMNDDGRSDVSAYAVKMSMLPMYAEGSKSARAERGAS